MYRISIFQQLRHSRRAVWGGIGVVRVGLHSTSSIFPMSPLPAPPPWRERAVTRNSMSRTTCTGFPKKGSIEAPELKHHFISRHPSSPPPSASQSNITLHFQKIHTHDLLWILKSCAPHVARGKRIGEPLVLGAVELPGRIEKYLECRHKRIEWRRDRCVDFV